MSFGNQWVTILFFLHFQFQEDKVNSSHGVANEIITNLNAYLPQVFFILMLFHTIYLLYFKVWTTLEKLFTKEKVLVKQKTDLLKNF